MMYYLAIIRRDEKKLRVVQMRKFLNCLKETVRTLRKGEQGYSPKLYSIAIFVAFMICVARFTHGFIKRIGRRENHGDP